MDEETCSLRKQELRISIRKKKQQYTFEQLLSLSRGIVEKLEKLPQFISSRTILLYYALPDEVQTQDFIKKWWNEKLILLPKVEGNILTLHPYKGKDNLCKGAYSIEEPKTPCFTQLNEIELAIIPGIAFDNNGNRLGRGKGFYDRLLEQLPKDIYKIGLAFPFQIVEEIPTTTYDKSVDEVIF